MDFILFFQQDVSISGADMMLRELKRWLKPRNFFLKTDVYSYCVSVNHSVLFQQIKSINWPLRFFEATIACCERTILRLRSSSHCKIGNPKDGSISTVLGTLYLTPLDQADG